MKTKTPIIEKEITQRDILLCKEYAEYIEMGATNMQALVQVATVNELDILAVFDALVRVEQSNPMPAQR